VEGPTAAEVRSRLLSWFDGGHRDLPWRRTKDPYRILLAEYLLQRTRVASGTPYFERFLRRFPDVASLAAASEEEVLRAWEGLGFYRRARNLHAAAKAVMENHGGRIPSNAATLATLPGIGPYTAGAVASIAFGEAVPAVDGNAIRVLSRLYLIGSDVARPPGRRRIDAAARSLVPPDRPGAFNQALMELGATVCTPRNPRCETSPLGSLCIARRAGRQSSLPRGLKARRPKAVNVAFAYVPSPRGVLLVRRPDRELLGGLWALPGGEIPAGLGRDTFLRDSVAAQTALRVRVGTEVARTSPAFSHRRWSGAVFRCVPRGRGVLLESARWVEADELDRLPLVPAHRKILADLRAQSRLETFSKPRHRKRG